MAVRARRELIGVLFQSKLFLRPIPGVMHLFLFWSFLVLLPTIVMSFLGAMNPEWTIPWLAEQGWFALMVDVFAVGTLLGVTIAFTIRLGQRPVRFAGSYLQVAYNILLFESAIVITLYLWHGSRIALGLNEYPAEWSPISNAVAGVLAGLPGLDVFERVVVWVHAILILSFLVYIPYTKHLHTLVVAFNVYFGRTRSRGRLEPLEFENPDIPEDQIRFGAGTIKDLTWKQMLDGMTCTECGRCQDACPAFFTGKDLSPKMVVQNIRDQLYEEGHAWLASRKPVAEGATPVVFDGQPLVPTAVKDETVWDCVTCGACVRECPVGIEHIDHIVDLRRNLVMVDSRFPAAGAQMLRDLERTSNPWGGGPDERVDWTEGLDVRILDPGDPAPEVLFWVGCARAYDERARCRPGPPRSCSRRPASTSRSLAPASAARATRPDGWATSTLPGAGQAEHRDPRQGRDHEDRDNLPPLLQHAGQRVQAIRRRVPGLHHTQLLADLVAQGRLRPQQGEERSPTTTPATSAATTMSARLRAPSCPRSAGRSRWHGARSTPSAAAPAAPTCGSMSAATRSTRSEPARPPPRERRRSRWPARSAPSCSTMGCRR